jgi:hypothetical protein
VQLHRFRIEELGASAEAIGLAACPCENRVTSVTRLRCQCPLTLRFVRKLLSVCEVSLVVMTLGFILPFPACFDTTKSWACFHG